MDGDKEVDMEFSFLGQTHNTFGGGPVSWVGDLLESETSTFGPALETIELTVFYPGISKRAHSSIPYEPPEKNTRRFERKRKTLRILWISQRQTQAMVGEIYLPQMTSDILLGSFEDAIDALQYGLERLTASDDFDKGSFLKWLREMKERPWGDGEALRETLGGASDRRRAAWQAQAEADPWSVLGIDWAKMAPNARDILDDPADWSNGDDFSPHGNDTGADIFAEWSRYARLTPERAVQQIGWSDAFDLDDDICWHEWVEINLALAFGHIKKKGRCPAKLAVQAHEVLTEQIARTANDTDWPFRDEYQKRMTRYCRILTSFI